MVPGAANCKTTAITWGPVLAIAYIVSAFFLSQILAGLSVSIYPLIQHWNQAQANHWIQSSVWGQFVYVFLAESLMVGALYLFLRLRRVSWRAIGWRKPRWSDLGWGLSFLPLYYLSYLVVVMAVQVFVPHLNTSQAQQIGFEGAHGAADLIVVFISLVLLPPFVEELAVRGFLYTSLKKSMPKVAAVITTSAIFASAHLQAGSGAPLLWIAFIDTFVLSLFLIYLRDKTNGLWANMTLHASKNLVAFISLVLAHKL